MTRYTVLGLTLAGIGFTLACGSAPPPKAEPAAAAIPAPPPSNPATGAAGAATMPIGSGAEASAATPEPKAEAAPAPAAQPKLYPVDVLTAPEMAYLIDYPNSGASEVANKTCSGKADEDANKRTECLTKAREKFGADVLRFKKDAKGRVKMFIYRRSGSALAELYTANVELKEVSANAVKVELKGGASGQRPIMKDRGNFEVKVPNGYSIELEDSLYGKLTYEAKVGLVAN